MGWEPWFGWKPGEEVGELVRVCGGVSCVAGLRGTTHVELTSYHSAYTVLWARVDSTHHPTVGEKLTASQQLLLKYSPRYKTFLKTD